MLRLVSRAVLWDGGSHMGRLKGVQRVIIRIPGLRTYSVKTSLPKLPLPALQQTMDKYLKAVKPIVSDDHYTRTQEVCKEFGKPGSVGEQLQKLLEEKRDTTDNWLADWWLDVAYLSNRSPCPIYVNPGQIFPLQDFRDQNSQLEFAAKIIAGVLDYKTLLDKRSLPVERMGDKPLCMAQFYKMLATCRIPGAKCDSLVTYPADGPNPPRHIIVAHNNHFFALDVLDRQGKPLSIDQIKKQLTKVVEMSPKPGPPIGIFTCEHRDTWGKLYAKLLKDKTNRSSFDEINRSITMLCLDQPLKFQEPMNRTTMIGHHVNHGGGSRWNTGNRWFDKTIQFIVSPDGSCGLNYEHSAAEGPPIIAIADHALSYALQKKENKPPAEEVTEPRKLHFNLTPELEEALEVAKGNIDNLIDDLEFYAMTFDKYGKNFVKSQKLSPDALIQVSFQLAYFRLYQRNPSTYESGSLRLFDKGRTDVIRSCSIDTHAFVKAMDDNQVAPQEKVELFRKAVSSHREYTSAVVQGQGIDRHLLGLKLTAKENGVDLPQLFLDHSFNASGCWTVATSQVASKHNAMLCYGPSIAEGYGICYNPMDDQINLCLSAWNSCPETGCKKMADAVMGALEDFHDLLTKA